MKTPRVGIAREGMHRSEHAGANQEGTKQRKRKRQDREQDGPDFQRIALFHHHRGMQQRGASDPRHQRRILDWIPEPPAAPAKFVIGPVGAHRDAEREKHPGGKRPGPHPACPGRIDAAFDQRCDRERKGNREPDIAEIKQRRMHREADILQDRIEVAALERRLRHTREGIGSGENEKLERGRDPGLHAQHIGAQRSWKVSSEDRDHRAENGEDQRPEQHRAFVVSPHAADLVDERLLRMRVLEHIGDREIGRDVKGGQRCKRERDEQELHDRHRLGDSHQRAIADPRPDHRQCRLNERQRQRQHERVMADLGDHFDAPCGAAAPGFFP